MKKEEFLKVIHHYTNSSTEEAHHIITLKKSFPYSQLLHALAARVSKDHALDGHAAELQLAAVYSADRAILKKVMQQTTPEPVPSPLASSLETITQHHSEYTPDVQLPVNQLTVESQTHPSDEGMSNLPYDVADEVLHDLQILNELKLNFEAMFMGTEVKIIKKIIDSPTAYIKSEEVDSPKRGKAPARVSGKTKAQRIMELAKELEITETTNPHEVAPPVARKGTKKTVGTGENIIEEIANSKSKIAPESRKQKEQLEIIDHFIKVQPSISGPKLANSSQGDLSTIKNGEFGDNVISETLVDILLKQGKKDKAIEVLKKLIWKFPQKKAYFAAQIEELKK